MKNQFVVFRSFLIISILFFLASCAPTEEDPPPSVRTYKLSDSQFVGAKAGHYSKLEGSGSITAGTQKSNMTISFETSNSNADLDGYESLNPFIVSQSLRASLTTGETATTVTNRYYGTLSGKTMLFLAQGADGNQYAVNQLNGQEQLMEKVISTGSASALVSFDTCESVVGLTCSGGETVAQNQETYTLLGKETVSTKFGNFETYKIRITTSLVSSYPSIFPNSSSTTTDWFYPSVGTVKRTTTMQLKDTVPQSTWDFTVSLVESNQL
jgi:hypothetical protein